jgi:hypothetical protein
MSLRTILSLSVAALLLPGVPAQARGARHCTDACDLVACNAEHCSAWRCDAHACATLASWPAHGWPPPEFGALAGIGPWHDDGPASAPPRRRCRDDQLDASELLRRADPGARDGAPRWRRLRVSLPRG